MLYFFRNFSTLTQYKLNVILILRRLRIRGSSFHVDSYLEEILTSFSNAKSRMLRSQQTQESTQKVRLELRQRKITFSMQSQR